jgi:D-glycero-alpha-D-manno-heptose-7-phosphate kinase
MIIRSKAPLRIGLAGGGTDVSPYSDLYGGKVLNATINLYARVSIEPLNNGKIILNSVDMGEIQELDSVEELELDGHLEILKGVYNRIVKDFVHKPLSFRLTTFVDVPKGSGLGSSSTITVAILGAFSEWLNLPLGEYDIAHLAFEIERKDLKMAGGKQDQYAATFGGFNFMEFEANDKVIVNPLRIKSDYLNELENNILIYYTGTSRLSGQIIEKQAENFSNKSENALEAAHRLKEQAMMMKEAILMGHLDKIGDILDFGWQHKKQTAGGISNPVIDELYEAAKKAGASGGKISGAGGGGFMMIYAPANARYTVIKALEPFGGLFYPFDFTAEGLTTWTAK